MSQSSSAFWKWSRLAAWGITRLCGPSRTSAVTSSPRWEAVEEDRPGPGAVHQGGIDLERLEGGAPAVGLGLLPHAGPDVGIDGLGPGDGAGRVVLHEQRQAREGLGEGGVEFDREGVALGAGQDELHAQQGRGDGQRAGDVVAVADEGQADPLQPAGRLAEGQQVGHRLAGVRGVGEGVDDGDRGVPGQLLDGRVGVGPHGEGVDELADHAREIGHALPDPEAHVLAAEEDRVAAELRNGGLETDAGPHRRLLEDHPQRPAGQRRRPLPAAVRTLQLGGQVQEGPGLLGRRLEQVDEVADHRGIPGIRGSGLTTEHTESTEPEMENSSSLIRLRALWVLCGCSSCS